MDKIRKFMYGRYGIDDLYIFMLKLYIVLIFINILVSSKILGIIETLVALLILYRLLSKNIYKRRLENEKFLKCKHKLLIPLNNIKRNYKDRKIYVYKKCRKCKKTLRLPLADKVGFKKVRCPNCKNENKYLILSHQKIEIIKGSV